MAIARLRTGLFALAAAAVVATAATSREQPDPLPSWNSGGTRDAIVRFVERVTTAGSPDFVRPAERIAVFDNDGTLGGEQPMYFQMKTPTAFRPSRSSAAAAS